MPTNPQPTIPWNQAPVPGSGILCHTSQLESLPGLSSLRRHARRLLTATGIPSDTSAEAIDRAILVIDELASNALRHGAQPASLALRDQGTTWLVVVTDAAPEYTPTPAVDRPAGQGGYGLRVVHDLATNHGTASEVDVKHVWAVLPKCLTGSDPVAAGAVTAQASLSGSWRREERAVDVPSSGDAFHPVAHPGHETA